MKNKKEKLVLWSTKVNDLNDLFDMAQKENESSVLYGIENDIRSLGKELASYKISVNAISPGLVNSGLMEDIVAAGVDRAGTKAYQQALDEHSGQGEAVSPEKAAALAVWLASEASRGLTGKNISAIWDKYEDIPAHLKEIMSSDIYNSRRIKPKDRGYAW